MINGYKCLVAASFLIATVGPAFSESLVDVNDFDIDGVKLYMSAAQVTAALDKEFGKSNRFTIYLPTRILPMRDRVNLISFVQDGYKISVSFTDAIPGTSSAPEQVNSVSFGPDGGPNGSSVNPQDALEKLWKAALTKYGKPDATHDDGSALWCDTVMAGRAPEGCNQGTPSLTFYAIQGRGRLTLSAGDLLEAKIENYARDHRPAAAPAPLGGPLGH